MVDRDDDIIRSGIMKKRGSRMWGERYFVLKGSVLYYYLKKQIRYEAKGTLALHGSCKISSVPSSDPKKKQYIFEISWPVIDHDVEDRGNSNNSNNNNTNSNSALSPIDPQNKGPDQTKRRLGFRRRVEDKKNDPNTAKVAAIAAGGVVAGSMTSGLGLLASMLLVGAASNHNHTTTSSGRNISDISKQIVLSCDNERDAQAWIDAIGEKIRELRENGQGIVFASNPGLSVESTRNEPPPELRLDEVEEWIKSSKWKVYNIVDGIRVFEQSFYDDNIVDMSRNGSSSSSSNISNVDISSSSDPPCLRVNVGVLGSVSETYSAIMTLPSSCRTGIMKSLRVISMIDNCTDIIHLSLDQIYLYPSWTGIYRIRVKLMMVDYPVRISPRDFCLTRYWKQNTDGSCVICLDSTFHHDCPLTTGYVRGELHAAYYITPIKEEVDDEQQSECLLTLIAQVQPKGWIPRQYGYQHRFLEQILLHVLDIRDCVDCERFVQLNFDATVEKRTMSVTHDNTTPNGQTSETGSLGTIPMATLPLRMWSEVDASTFRVRGLTYIHDKVKTNSGPALFKLEAVDIFELPEATHNISAHPRNRIALAKQRGENFWALVFNIMIPGPPFYSFVVYWTGDKSLLEQDTPFGRIARPFFYGTDDEFRNNRFKLIPKIVDGNMIIKMAVKDTPTLLGNKLKQYYYRDDHYFEIDVDVGSSSVARNIVGLAIGYSKSIVVDLGLCLQGNDESELPEVMMGCAACIHADMSMAKKL